MLHTVIHTAPDRATFRTLAVRFLAWRAAKESA